MGSDLDLSVVRTADGVRHARLHGAPILLCGREIPADSHEYPEARDVECAECLEEAARRDRSTGVVEA